MSKSPSTLHLTVLITQEGGWYVARCLEIDAVSQGETAESALANSATSWRSIWRRKGHPKPFRWSPRSMYRSLGDRRDPSWRLWQAGRGRVATGRLAAATHQG
jgi:hypothetical protein